MWGALSYIEPLTVRGHWVDLFGGDEGVAEEEEDGKDPDELKIARCPICRLLAAHVNIVLVS